MLWAGSMIPLNRENVCSVESGITDPGYSFRESALARKFHEFKMRYIRDARSAAVEIYRKLLAPK